MVGEIHGFGAGLADVYVVKTDSNGNSSSGTHLYSSKSSGNIVVSDDNKLIAIRGLDDFIVVDTPDALLVCPKSDEQWVQTLVGELKDDNK